MPQIGLILTSAPSIAWLREQLQLARADVLKIVPAWGLPWNEQMIAEAARLAPALVVRTSWGDPSYRGGLQAMPEPDKILAELRPWLAARPDAWVEIGNEPLIADQATEQAAWDYRYYLDKAITEIRKAYPQARLIAPAHIRNHQIRLGDYADGQRRWDAICGDPLGRCDALGLHAYSVSQAVSGIKQLREVVSVSLPIWLTEWALNEQLEPAARGRRYREILDVLPVAAALLYHLDHSGGVDPVHFNANYRLEPGTLAALAAPAPAAPMAPAPIPAKPAPAPPRPAPTPAKPFAVDIRHWPTVEAFAAHLAAHSPSVCSWVKGVTLHHTIRPGIAAWKGRASVEDLVRYYRDQAPWVDAQGQQRKGWSAGPQLFLGPDGLWQLTPLNMRGCHAVSFNATHWGWEIVGQYDLSPWSPAMRELVEGALAVSLRWLGKPASVINGHRDDPKTTKSCPGRAIDLNVVRANVARRMAGGSR